MVKDVLVGGSSVVVVFYQWEFYEFSTVFKCHGKTEVCLCFPISVADLRYLIITKSITIPTIKALFSQGFWAGAWQPECPLPLSPGQC